jgi:hypothetical protein
MKWAALITWVITASGGFGLLAIWLQRGGVKQSDQPGRRIRPPLIFGHMALAATGLVLWIIYVASGTKAFAWIGFVLLLVVATLGFTMLALWLQRRQAGATPAVATTGASTTMAEGSTPAEQHFPVPLVGAHGLFAAITLVLALLAALNV